jgi:hypothetical protein
MKNKGTEHHNPAYRCWLAIGKPLFALLASFGKYVLLSCLCFLALAFGFRPGLAGVAPEPPLYSIADFVICADAKMDAPHDWHILKNVFQSSDSKFFAWVEITNAVGTHSVEMKVYRPDGTYYGKETQRINETNGPASWWRMAAWWDIKDDKVAEMPGRWKLDLLIDDVFQRSIYFNIIAANPAQSDVAGSADPNTPKTGQAASGNSTCALCIIEASPDLVHWTPIQTNALPPAALSTMPSSPAFRLRLANSGAAVAVELSGDLATWTPFQTNTLPSAKSLNPAAGTPAFYRAVVRF